MNPRTKLVVTYAALALGAAALVILGIAIGRGGLAGRQPAEKPKAAETTPSPSEPAPSPLPASDGSIEPTAPVPTEPMRVRVYFEREGKLGVAVREIPPTKAVATAAMRQLLLGPNSVELAAGLDSAVPVGTELISVSIVDGTATVDVTDEFASDGDATRVRLRLAQVVYTLTQFRTVERVSFRMEGEPVRVLGGGAVPVGTGLDRKSQDSVLPAIFVETPAPGETVESPIRVTGLNNTFEATFAIEVLDPNGARIVQKAVTSGAMGEWRAFDIQIRYATPSTGIGTLVVYEVSAMDGSAVNVIRIPVKLVR